MALVRPLKPAPEGEKDTEPKFEYNPPAEGHRELLYCQGKYKSISWTPGPCVFELDICLRSEGDYYRCLALTGETVFPKEWQWKYRRSISTGYIEYHFERRRYKKRGVHQNLEMVELFTDGRGRELASTRFNMWVPYHKDMVIAAGTDQEYLHSDYYDQWCLRYVAKLARARQRRKDTERLAIVTSAPRYTHYFSTDIENTIREFLDLLPLHGTKRCVKRKREPCNASSSSCKL